jgi:CBS domain containing-hemolysin-like protein
MLTGNMQGLSLLQFVAVAMLILGNAFFVAAEFALVSIRDTRVEQMLAARVPGSRAVRRLQLNMDDFLPAVQLGVTLCSLALGWIGEPLAATVVLGWMGAWPHALLYAHAIAITVGFALITYVDVVLGELVPKSLALRRVEALALAVAPPMILFITVARPIVRFLKGSAAIILRSAKVPMTRKASVHSPEELKLIATAARRVGALPRYQETLIHRTIELDSVTVHEIMTPRQKIFSLPSNMLIEEASAWVIDRQHSRVPVYDEARGPEHIIGVVYSRDLARLMYFHPLAQQRRAALATGRLLPLPAKVPVGPRKSNVEPAKSVGFIPRINSATTAVASASAGSSPVKPHLSGPSQPQKSGAPAHDSGTKDTTPAHTVLYPITPFVELKLRQVMREVLVAPETKTVLNLIREFQRRRRHMAIVVDEYGSTVGLVTAEDAIEQLTGEFEDEFDDPARPVITTASGAFLMEGSVNLRDLETQMQWDLPREGGIETLAGFVLMRLGHIPHPGESVIYEDRRLTVVEMEGHRIAKIRVEPVVEDTQPAESAK